MSSPLRLLLLFAFPFSAVAQIEPGKDIRVIYERDLSGRYSDEVILDVSLKSMVSEYKYLIKEKITVPMPDFSSSAYMYVHPEKYDHYYFWDSRKNIRNRVLLDHDNVVVHAQWTTPQDEWKITSETKEILGYKVIKATKPYENNQGDYIAWFAPDIPLGVGPEHFNGLPGLILECFCFSKFTAKSISAIDLPPIEMKKKGFEISSYYVLNYGFIKGDYLKEQEDKMIKRDKNYKRQVKDAWWKFW